MFLLDYTALVVDLVRNFALVEVLYFLVAVVGVFLPSEGRILADLTSTKREGFDKSVVLRNSSSKGFSSLICFLYSNIIGL